MDRDKTYTVSELAKLFDLTPQALRFYEEKGLLAPGRISGARFYTYRDRARLQMIQRFRRLGFSLEDIAEYLDLYRPGQAGAAQYRVGLEKIRRRLSEMEQMRREVDTIIAELHVLEDEALSKIDSAPDDGAAPDRNDPASRAAS